MVLQTMLEVALNSVRPFVDVLPLSTRGSWLSLRGRDLRDLHEREETLQHRRQKHVVIPTRVHRLLHQLEHRLPASGHHASSHPQYLVDEVVAATVVAGGHDAAQVLVKLHAGHLRPIYHLPAPRPPEISDSSSVAAVASSRTAK